MRLGVVVSWQARTVFFKSRVRKQAAKSSRSEIGEIKAISWAGKRNGEGCRSAQAVGQSGRPCFDAARPNGDGIDEDFRGQFKEPAAKAKVELLGLQGH